MSEHDHKGDRRQTGPEPHGDPAHHARDHAGGEHAHGGDPPDRDDHHASHEHRRAHLGTEVDRAQDGPNHAGRGPGGEAGAGATHASGHAHHGHDHAGHGHGHAHHHAPPDRLTRAFGVGILLNVAFVVTGVITGIAAHSTALLADAAHNFGDVLGLAMAWGATVLARRARTTRRTYGLRRTTILAALGNGGLVLFAIGGVVWEAVQRIGAGAAVDGGLVAAVAALGVVLNSAAALMFARGRSSDMNVRGAFLHLVADAAVSAGVVVAGIIVWQTGWAWIDPAASLAVSVVIVGGTWRLVREAIDLLLDAVPAHIDPEAVEAYLAGLPGVTDVHDLHIWSMSTTEVALTAHLILPWDTCAPTMLADASSELARRFRIGHATIQLEPVGHGENCDRAAAGAV
jgi:cobalt-zinc-cadmium efflux system protein